MRIKMFAGLLMPVLAVAAATWTPDAMMKVKSVAAVVPSPDGQWAVWTERQAVMESEKSEFVDQVFLGKTDGSQRIQLTHAEKSSTQPQFSTDGKYVYFASDRGAKNQIYRMPVDGGEAEAVTDFKGGVGPYQISPNGKWIAFAGRETDSDDERAKREKRDFRVLDENPKNQSLWLVASEGKAPAKKLASGPYHVGAFDWAPDSRTIAYEIRPTPDADNGRLADIMEVDLESGAAKSVANTPGAEAQPRYSRDGKYLAYVRTAAASSTIAPARIILLTRANGATRELPASFDESPALMHWSKDRLLFLEGKGTRTVVYSVPVDGPITPIYQPSQGTLGFAASLNRGGTYAGFTLQSSNEPPEAYVMDIASGKPVRVSAANMSIPHEALGVTKSIHWKGKDGRDVEGLLTLPPDYKAGTKIPLILNIHGGPAGAFGEQFIGSGTIYPLAAFAEKGWAVLRPNPRGSTSYGRPFRSANVNDWGGGDYQDIMAGVDEVIRQGIADPDRMAVMGWSYGGYMTNWVITQTNRFKCAAAGAGLTNMPSMWGTNDIPSVLDDYFTGPWYEQPERYLQQSPLYHVKNVKTPTLYLHGESDNRVPISQAFEMYHAIKRLGIETQMVTYPRQPHGPQEPKFILDIMQRHIAWVEKHINPAASGN